MKSQLVKNYGNNQVELQKKFAKIKEQIDKRSLEIEDMTFAATSSDKSIEVVVKGDKSLSEIKIINEKLLSAESKEMLQDLIVVTANEAFSKVDKFTDDEISKITKDLPNLPGLGF